MPLTDTGIKALKAAAKDYKRADEKGLSLLVKTTGAKWWRFSYRHAGKPKTISMGVYPDTTLKMAREKRDEARQMLAHGIDPSARRKALKATDAGETKDSFAIIAQEWLDQKKPDWDASYFSKVATRLHNDVLPGLGRRPITEIKAPDILRVLRKIEERGAIESAHRIRETIGQIFRYGIITGRAERNPAPDLIGALSRSQEKHMAAITEPEKVGAFLRKIHDYNGTFTVRNALQLAPLVFVRPGELRQAEWKDINFDTAEWRFKASKTHHDHIVPLSRQAVDLLKSLFPFSGHGRYVFPSNKSDAQPMSNNAVLSALRNMGIDKEEMSGHGFRAMARTMIAERLRYEDVVIELQLAHQVRDIHGHAYNRTSFLDDRKQMMQEWADYLDNLKDGRDELPYRSNTKD